jgi:DNA-binding transcriptional regulator of glucitol operon
LKELVISEIVVAWAGAEFGIMTIAPLSRTEDREITRNFLMAELMVFGKGPEFSELTLFVMAVCLGTRTSPWSKTLGYPRGSFM